MLKLQNLIIILKIYNCKKQQNTLWTADKYTDMVADKSREAYFCVSSYKLQSFIYYLKGIGVFETALKKILS